MERANATLNLAGNTGQQVQKWGITPAEAAVLRFIHGDDALTEVKVIGTITRKTDFERERLIQAYGKGLEGEIRAPAVEALFPGLASKLPTKFAELPAMRTEGDPEETEEIFTPIAGDTEASEIFK